MNTNEMFQIAWQLTALAIAVYSFVFCLRVANSRGPVALAKYLAVFAIMAIFAMRVLPLVADYMIANTMYRMQHGYAGQVVAETANNTMTVMGKAISGVSMQALPGVDPVAPIAPPNSQPRLTRPEIPAGTPVHLPTLAPVSNAADMSTQHSVPTPTAPATTDTWSNSLGTDKDGNAYAGPAAPAHYAPLGTDERGKLIQGPVAPSFFDSPTIKTVTGQPDGGPSVTAANAMTWTASPTVQTIITYQVKRGDTMYKIALAHYGDGHRWPDICRANPMPDCNTLRAGMVLKLP